MCFLACAAVHFRVFVPRHFSRAVTRNCSSLLQSYAQQAFPSISSCMQQHFSTIVIRAFLGGVRRGKKQGGEKSSEHTVGLAFPRLPVSPFLREGKGKYPLKTSLRGCGWVKESSPSNLFLCTWGWGGVVKVLSLCFAPLSWIIDTS